MIKLIGFRRAILLAIVLGLNLFMAAVYFFGVDPLRTDTETKLNGVDAQISQLSHNTQNIKTELAAYKDNHEKYDDLKVKGFFSPQDRFEAGRQLDDLRAKSGPAQLRL